MNQNLIDKIKSSNPIPEEVSKLFRSYGFVTGSQIFKCENKTSDLDIVLKPDFPYNFYDIKNMGGIYEDDYCDCKSNTEYFYTIYVNVSHSGYIYNLILTKTIDTYNKWFKATNLMKDLIKTNSDFRNLIQDKKKRIKIFETFKEIS